MAIRDFEVVGETLNSFNKKTHDASFQKKPLTIEVIEVRDELSRRRNTDPHSSFNIRVVSIRQESDDNSLLIEAIVEELDSFTVIIADEHAITFQLVS